MMRTPPPRCSCRQRSPPDPFERCPHLLDRESRQLSVRNSDGPAPPSRETHRRDSRLHLESPVDEDDLDGLSGGESQRLTQRFGNHEPAGGIDGSSHGTRIPSESRRTTDWGDMLVRGHRARRDLRPERTEVRLPGTMPPHGEQRALAGEQREAGGGEERTSREASRRQRPRREAEPIQNRFAAARLRVQPADCSRGPRCTFRHAVRSSAAHFLQPTPSAYNLARALRLREVSPCRSSVS